MNVTQEQAYKIRKSIERDAKVDSAEQTVTVTLTLDEWYSMAHLLNLITLGDLAAPAPSYAQPGLLADEDGGPLFSMMEG